MVITRRSLLLVACSSIALFARTAGAQCSGNSYWTSDLNAPLAGAASAPANDTQFAAATPQTVIAQGSRVSGITSADIGGGGAMWSIDFAKTVQNFPSPVPLSDGSEAVFIAGSDGALYRYDNGVFQWSAPTQRGGCPLDMLIATPTVQLKNFATTNFKNLVNDDLVFVVTRYTSGSGTACDTITRNKVIAYKASTGALFWTFNPIGTQQMDYGSEGCYIDYDSVSKDGTLYCGTNLVDGSLQNSLWAIDTITGARKWAVAAGSIHTRPQVVGTKIYSATFDGTLRAFNTGDGSSRWSQPVTGGTISRNPWIEFRTGGYSGLMLIVDSAGLLYGFTDGGVSATAQSWSPKALATPIKSMAAVSNAIGKAYVGLSNGTIHQVDLTTGADEASATVGNGTVYDAALDVSMAGGSTVNRLSVAASFTMGATVQRLRKFCIPWTAGTMGLLATQDPPTRFAGGACNSVTNPCDAAPAGACYVIKCDAVTGVCFSDPKSKEGLACADGLTCSTSPKTCHAGNCVASAYTNCQPSTVGDRACPPGSQSCGSLGCVNVLSDSNNCGACGVKCALNVRYNAICVNGVCQKDRNFCGIMVNKGGLSAVPIPGATSLAYTGPEDFTQLTGTCNAQVPTWPAAPAGSVTFRVNDNQGAKTAYPAGGAIHSFHGIDTTNPDGGSVNGYYFATMVDAAIDNPLGFFVWNSAVVGQGTAVRSFNDTAPMPTADPNNLPFMEKSFDRGPVGPAVDKTVSNDPNRNGARLFYGNWKANGDLYSVNGLAGSFPPGAWTATAVPNTAWTGAPVRVHGVAWSRRAQFGLHDVLYVAWGTTITVIDTTKNPLTKIADVDLNTYQGTVGFDHDQGEAKVADILSISADGIYGFLYIEMREQCATPPNCQHEFLVMHPYDFSVRNLQDVHDDLAGSPTWPVPTVQSTAMTQLNLTRVWPANDDGHISAQSGQQLERISPVFKMVPLATGYADLPEVP